MMSGITSFILLVCLGLVVCLCPLQAFSSDAEVRIGLLAALAGTEVTAPAEISGTVHAMHLFVVECERRNDLKTHLSSRNIQTGFQFKPDFTIPLPFINNQPTAVELWEKIYSKIQTIFIKEFSPYPSTQNSWMVKFRQFRMD